MNTADEEAITSLEHTILERNLESLAKKQPRLRAKPFFIDDSYSKRTDTYELVFLRKLEASKANEVVKSFFETREARKVEFYDFLARHNIAINTQQDDYAELD